MVHPPVVLRLHLDLLRFELADHTKQTPRTYVRVGKVSWCTRWPRASELVHAQVHFRRVREIRMDHVLGVGKLPPADASTPAANNKKSTCHISCGWGYAHKWATIHLSQRWSFMILTCDWYRWVIVPPRFLVASCSITEHIRVHRHCSTTLYRHTINISSHQQMPFLVRCADLFHHSWHSSYFVHQARVDVVFVADTYLSHSRYCCTHSRRRYQSEDNHHTTIWELRYRITPLSEWYQRPGTTRAFFSGAIRPNPTFGDYCCCADDLHRPHAYTIKTTKQGSHKTWITAQWIVLAVVIAIADGTRLPPIDQYLNKARSRSAAGNRRYLWSEIIAVWLPITSK